MLKPWALLVVFVAIILAVFGIQFLRKLATTRFTVVEFTLINTNRPAFDQIHRGQGCRWQTPPFRSA
jgi:hypothetical protein